MLRLALLAFLNVGFSYALDLHAPAFERLDESALTSQLQSAPKNSSQRAAAHFFLSESLEWREKIHAAEEHLDAAADICDAFGDYQQVSDRGAAALVCALVHSERLARASSWNRSDEAEALERDFSVISASSVSQNDRLYVEGRVLGLLPRGQGRNVGRAVLALESLKRLAPQYPSTYFWLFRVHELAGNRERAQEAYSEMKTRFSQDIRLTGYERRRAIGSLDPRFGIIPAISYGPGIGLGVGLILLDDRMFDTVRRGVARMYGTTRGNFGTQFTLNDYATWEGSELIVTGAASSTLEDYFGIGIGARYANATELDVRRVSGGIFIRQNVVSKIYLMIGWDAHAYHLENAKGPLVSIGLPQSRNSFYSGAVGEMGWDDQQGETGFSTSIRGFFPVKDVASSSTFKRWDLKAFKGWALGGRYFLSVSGHGIIAEGNVPFDAYPKLAGDWDAPGIRYNRYRDRNGLVFSPELKKEISPSMRIGGFTVAGSLDTSVSDLLKRGWKYGAGGFMEFSYGRTFAGSSRIEAGFFNEEWVIGAMAGTTL